MLIKEWLQKNIVSIVSDSPQLDAELLLSERLGKSRAYIRAFDDDNITEDIVKQLDTDVQKLAKGYPLAYIIGKKSFWDMELCVTEDTLIPRADTETVIEVVCDLFAPHSEISLIDLGTGSGAIALALSRIFTKAHIVATDISEKALAVAQKNAQQWQGSDITFVKTSWLDGFDKQKFNLIVSNPPYIIEDDEHLTNLTYEPIAALTAADNGLADIITIVEQATQHIHHDGWLVLEHGYHQGSEVRALLGRSGWQNIQTHRDLGGNERLTIGQFCAIL